MGKFGGFGGGGGMNMQQMLKQAQQLQAQMQQAQQELEELEIEGTSGGGLVTVVLNGHKKLLGISIDPQAVDIDDLEMLEDLIISAYNVAFAEAEAEYAQRMPQGL